MISNQIIQNWANFCILHSILKLVSLNYLLVFTEEELRKDGYDLVFGLLNDEL